MSPNSEGHLEEYLTVALGSMVLPRSKAQPSYMGCKDNHVGHRPTGLPHRACSPLVDCLQWSVAVITAILLPRAGAATPRAEQSHLQGLFSVPFTWGQAVALLPVMLTSTPQHPKPHV